MAVKKVSKALLKEWEETTKTVENMTKQLAATSNKNEKDLRIGRAMIDYQFFVNTYFPHYTMRKNGTFTMLADFHINAAELILNPPTDQFYGCFQWHRGSGKSTNMSLFIPIWLLIHKKMHNLLLVSKNQQSATRLLMHIQAELEYNQLLISDFGKPALKTVGNWQKDWFIVEHYECQFSSIGRCQDARGIRYKNYRTDYVLMDDVDDSELVRSKQRIVEAVDWMKESLFNTVGPDFRIIMVENLYSNNSLLKHFMDIPDAYVSKVNAIKEDGTPSWPEYFTIKWLENKKRNIGNISFQREYMNNPVLSGSLFKGEWFQYLDIEIEKLELESRFIVAYFDPSFTATGDYKAICCLGYDHKTKRYLVDKFFCRKASINEAIGWLYNIFENYRDRGIQCYPIMEASFAQGVLYTEIQTVSKEKGYSLPLSLDSRQKPQKYMRIEGLTPIFERLQVYWNKLNLDEDMKTAIEQFAYFEKGSSSNDDAPDSFESAYQNVNNFIRTINLDNILINPINNNWDEMADNEAKEMFGW